MTSKLLLPLFILTLFLTLRIYPLLNLITEPFPLSTIQQLYQHSQFAENPANRWWVIEDWELYPFAGIHYITSGDLSKVNIEHPPLGKYLFGATYFLTSRPALLQIALAFLWLVISYLLALKILKSQLLAVLVPLGVMIEPLFIYNLTHNLLDQSFATAILLFLYFSTLKPSKQTTIFLGVSLGLVASIKYPVTAVLLFMGYLISLALDNYKLTNNVPSFLTRRGELKARGGFLENIIYSLKPIPTIAGISILIYMLTYLPLLLSQGITSFINLQIQALKIHLAHVPNYPLLAPLRVLLFNQWPVWFDNTNPLWPVPQWQFTWPLLGLSLLVSPFLFWKFYKELKPFSLVFFFTWIYFIFINTRLFFPNYLYPLLPLGYILLTLTLQRFLSPLLEGEGRVRFSRKG